MRKVDAAVIGFGKGGKALAGALAAAGKAVVVITHDELLARLAGDCTVRLEAGNEGTTHDRNREASS